VKTKIFNKLTFQHLLAISAVIIYEQVVILVFYGKILLSGFIYYLVNIPLFYLGASFLFPLLSKKKFTLFAFLFSLSLIIFILLHITAYKVQMLLVNQKWSSNIDDNVYKSALTRFVYILGYSFAYYNARIGIQKAREARQKELHVMEQERNQAQLENAYLRSQINPHLLFNSLQFIEYQVEKGSPSAIKAVQLLGELMQYSLKSTAGSDTVPLEDELTYVNLYVSLMRLRNDDRQYLSVTVNSKDAASGLCIPPGIIGNFTENLFKHGDLSERGDPGLIVINVLDRHFSMEVRNLKRTYSNFRESGIGMKNIHKRLELLYPNAYTLRTTEENNHYNLYFEIEL